MFIAFVALGIMLLDVLLAVLISNMDSNSAREMSRKVLIAGNLLVIVAALVYSYFKIGPGAGY